MKLTIHVLKQEGNDYEIRIADPPFYVDYSIQLHENGRITVDLSEDAVHVLRNELRLDDGDWFDSIQWSASLEDLVAKVIDSYCRRGELAVDVKSRDELLMLASTLERAATMIRSVEFFDADAWDAQFAPGIHTASGFQILGWKPYGGDGES